MVFSKCYCYALGQRCVLLNVFIFLCNLLSIGSCHVFSFFYIFLQFIHNSHEHCKTLILWAVNLLRRPWRELLLEPSDELGYGRNNSSVVCRCCSSISLLWAERVVLFQLCPLEGVKALLIGPAYVSSQVALARKDSLAPVRITYYLLIFPFVSFDHLFTFLIFYISCLC